MILFFRKIRKQFADDNKPLKYMRYAIREIVLAALHPGALHQAIPFRNPYRVPGGTGRGTPITA